MGTFLSDKYHPNSWQFWIDKRTKVMKDPKTLRIENEMWNFIMYGIKKPQNNQVLEVVDYYNESLTNMISDFEHEFYHIPNPAYKLMIHLYDVQDEMLYEDQREMLNRNK